MKTLIKITAILLLMTACKTQLVEPESYLDNISGRYQNDETAIVLLLEHYQTNLDVIVHLDGKVFDAKGKYDKVNKQVMFSGRCFYPQYGEMEISFILFVDESKRLSGNWIMQNQFWNTGSQLISFRYINSLSKHNQGGIL
jgi:hypothetical protein